jgi:hypothetical protein
MKPKSLDTHGKTFRPDISRRIEEVQNTNLTLQVHLKVTIFGNVIPRRSADMYQRFGYNRLFIPEDGRKKVETCSKIATCLCIIVCNYSTVAGIHVVTASRHRDRS